jgi:hypothetical protein
VPALSSWTTDASNRRLTPVALQSEGILLEIGRKKEQQLHCPLYSLGHWSREQLISSVLRFGMHSMS